MDVAKILAELRQEREQITEAILGLERLDRSRESEVENTAKRRGRPPGSKNKATPRSVSAPAFAEMLQSAS